jgi:hypothetical protein
MILSQGAFVGGLALARFHRGVEGSGSGRQLLEGHRCVIAQRGMQALSVVEDFHILKDAGSRLLDGLELVALDTFACERSEKDFHQRIVVGFPFPAHTQDNPVAFQDLSIGATGVLAPTVGVMHQAGLRPPPKQRHL